MFNHRFPYTNFHEINLDWILAKLKYLEDNISGGYILPSATKTRLGGIKVGRNLSITDDGVLDARDPEDYVLPIATRASIGGVRVGPGLSIDVNTGILSTVQSGGGGGAVPVEKEYYVSPAGSDVIGDGTEGNPWNTVEHAIKECNGDYNTIWIMYYEGNFTGTVSDLDIRKNIKLRFQISPNRELTYKLSFTRCKFFGTFTIGYNTGLNVLDYYTRTLELIDCTVEENGKLVIDADDFKSDANLIRSLTNKGTFSLQHRQPRFIDSNTGRFRIDNNGTGYIIVYSRSKTYMRNIKIPHISTSQNTCLFYSADGKSDYGPELPLPFIELQNVSFNAPYLCSGNAIIYADNITHANRYDSNQFSFV